MAGKKDKNRGSGKLLILLGAIVICMLVVFLMSSQTVTPSKKVSAQATPRQEASDVDDEAVPLRVVPGYSTQYQILREGPKTGAKIVKKGASVTVHATGVVQQTGKKFWSTKDTNQPFQYQAGVGGVITGWDQGCLGMKLGEERRLIIPAHEGYGEGGFPAWGIPPGGTLDFTIEVLNIDL